MASNGKQTAGSTGTLSRDEDDLGSSGSPATGGPGSTGKSAKAIIVTGGDPDRDSGSPSGGSPTATPGAGGPMVVDEVTGQVIAEGLDSESGEESAETHAEVGAEGAEAGEEFVEASPEALTEADTAESAFTDLRSVEGFVETGPEAIGRATVLPDAGSSLESGEEFFPFLAGLASKVIPLLTSTLGPLLGKAIAPKLSAPAQKVLQKRQATGGTDIIAILAKLLQTAQQGAGARGEATGEEAVDEATVEEMVAAIETIIGTDDRVRIQNTSRVPWRRVCALRISMPSGATYRGTGFFIGPRTVATAGHCLFQRRQGGWARSIEVIPGANGAQRPFGSVVATSFRSTRGWVDNAQPAADYGAVVLPTGAFGSQQIGSFGFGALPAATLLAQPAVLAGYPGDKPFAELWGMARRIKSVTPSRLLYDIDTMGGQSGSGLYIRQNGKRVVVGIHNYGSSSGNSATRITAPVFSNLLNWSKL